MAGDFDLYYADNPWTTLNKNQRDWIDPDLTWMYRRRSTFAPTVTYARDLSRMHTTRLVVSQLLDPHPNTTPLSARQIWMPASRIDSRAREIRFARYGGKMAYHKYDDMITYWQVDGRQGLRNISKRSLGVHMVDVLDMLVRNAYIAGAWKTGYTVFEGGATNFGNITTADRFDPSTAADIALGMKYREVPGALGPDGQRNAMVAFTSPGVIYDIKKDDDWKDISLYAQPGNVLNGEVGTFENTRYIEDPRMTLWNCGPIIARAPVILPINGGDGSPDPEGGETTKVDGTWMVGQAESPDIKHYIQLGEFSDGSLDDIKENDMLTIHTMTTDTYGVVGGVNFQEGKLHNRRLVAIDRVNGRLAFDTPIMEDFAVQINGGVYAYVSKGSHIHGTIFVGARDGLAAGVGQSPKTYELDPIDDWKSIFRFSWDTWVGYQPWNPEVFEVVFSAGTVRLKGPKVIQ